MSTVHVCVCTHACMHVWVRAFSLFSLVLLDWLGFTLKVADHLRQIAWSNRLNEKQPASTSTTQNVDCVNETLVYCTDILYPLAMTWIISKKAKKKKKKKHIWPTQQILITKQNWESFKGRQ